MPFINALEFNLKDRVLETTQTSGTGAYQLDGVSVDGRQSFLTAVGDGERTTYVVQRGTTWERGLGTVSAGAPVTLSRDLILGTSADDSVGADPIDWPTSDAKDILVDCPSNLLNQITDPARLEAAEDRITELNGQIAAFVGAKALFVQDTAPTGWSQDVTEHDRVLRIVNDATGGGTGGNWDLTGMSVDGHALTVGEMPSHDHDISVSDGGGATQRVARVAGDVDGTQSTQNRGGGNAHTHGLTNTSWRPSYQNVIVCENDDWLVAS